MQKLIQGIHDFRAGPFRDDKALFERLAQGQNPEALFITCADSRITPNLVTNTKPGDLFVLRNAGNIVPAYNGEATGESATIEYAVSALGVKNIIVCGHSHCGAMAALLRPEARAPLPLVDGWLNHAEATRRIVLENYTELDEPNRVKVAIQENVLMQIENLRTHPTVAAAIARGDLGLHGWVYKFETGEVFSFDAQSGQFGPIKADEDSGHVRRRVFDTSANPL